VTAPAAEVALVDFGMGNLRNVARALERAGAKPRVTADPDDVLNADRVVLPGVGALGDCMRGLRELGVDEALRERIDRGRPYLGLCLGLQVLFEEGDEGNARGLGLIPGRVGRFDSGMGLPIPHMGWNAAELESPHPVVPEGYYYFVHSYRPAGVPPEAVVATTEYGERFASAVGAGSAVAVQFHPEKSQRVGLELLERYCQWDP
jgi:glutamine amidotransferase